MGYLKNGEVDIKGLLWAQVKYWYLYAGTLLICLVAAFLYNRYTIEQYQAMAAVRIESASSQSIDPTKILFGSDASPFRNDIQDEVFQVKSFPIVSQTVAHLGLGVNYYRLTEKLGRYIDIYNDAPFWVDTDALSEMDGLSGDFEVRKISDQGFSLKYDGVKEKAYAWGEPIKFGEQSITLNLKEGIDISVFEGVEWVFNIPGVYGVTFNYIDRLNVSPKSEDSRVLFFELTGGNREKEQDFLDALLFFYIQDNLRVKNQVAANTIDFIEGELKEIRDSLNTIETRLELFKSSNKISDLSSEAGKVFDQLVELEEEKALLKLRDRYYAYLVEYLSNDKDAELLVSPESFGVQDATLNQVVVDIIQAQLRIKSLEERGNQQNPVYAELTGRVKQLQQVLSSSLQSAQRANKLKLDEVDRRLKFIENSMRSFPGSEIQLINIERLYKISENLYLLLMEKKAEAEISLSSNTSDIRIVEPARLSSPLPISPNKRLIYILAVLSALVLAFLFQLVKEYLNDKIISKNDVLERLDLPFAGDVVTAKEPELDYLKRQPKSQLAECFRSIRFNFNYMIGHIESPVILVTSTIPGEGKTFFSSRLAYAVAGPEKKGIIIGADLRKPKLHHEFDLENKLGLSSYLAGTAGLEEVIIPFSPDLDVITAGPVPPNPLELLEKPKFQELIKELRQRYYFIIIDTPPVGLVAEGAEIMKVADLSVFVLRSGYSPLTSLERIKDIQTNMKNQRFAFVLNDLDSQSGYGYYGKYGYYRD